MGSITIVATDTLSRAELFSNEDLPANYMGDFSRLGFVVDRYLETCSILESAGFEVRRHQYGATLFFKDYTALPEIQNLLAQRHIYSEYTDIADTFYQA